MTRTTAVTSATAPRLQARTTTTHPDYSAYEPEWRQMRDTYAGERTVKGKATTYLPATAGMYEDGYGKGNTAGTRMYEAYRLRARYPDLVKDTVEMLLGVMHSKPPTITLPAEMEYLRKRASSEGEGLAMLLQRINEQQLIPGRLGLLVDVIGDDAGERAGEFYIGLYFTEHIVNWDEARYMLDVSTLNMLVLDETAQRRQADGLSWETHYQQRVLTLGPPTENVPISENSVCRTATVENESYGRMPDESAWETPVYKGRPVHVIPFTFVNAVDLLPSPDHPPLLGLSNLALTIYRGEADYRQSLFMQGQDTLVKIGSPSDDLQATRLGVGAVIAIPSTQGDAKFIGVDSKGLPEQRAALQNDYDRGEQFAGKLMDSVSRERESGDALRIRVATRTATLNRIAIAGATGLQTSLRQIGMWMGLSEDAVEAIVVEPNLDFVNDQMTGEQLRALIEAKAQGAPISYESVHTLMGQRNMTEMGFEEEIEKIRKEKALEDLLEPEPPATPDARKEGNNPSPSPDNKDPAAANPK